MKVDSIQEFVKECELKRKERQAIRNRYKDRLNMVKKNKVQEQGPSDIVRQVVESDRRPKTQKVEVQKEIVAGGQNDEEHKLLQQNKALKEQLILSQKDERTKMELFTITLGQIKDKCASQFEKMRKKAIADQKIIQEKIDQIKKMTPVAEQKNSALQKMNASLRQEVKEGTSILGKYATEVKQQYESKIQQIEKIYNDSNQKISEYENNFNQNQFVEKTLQSQQLLQGIQQNAQKAAQASQLLTQYQTLLEGKTQMLGQIRKATDMKTEELSKMAVIEGKIKEVLERLNKERENILRENHDMAEQLRGVRELLDSVVQGQNLE